MTVVSSAIRDVLVLGGGSAGFLSAITLKARLPQLNVTVLRSKELGIIGVGEGTTTTVPFHLHEFLKLPLKSFYEITQPTWKLGIRFIWGTRPYFNFIFGHEMDARHKGMRKGAGHYCDEGAFDYVGYPSSLMCENKVFYRTPNGPRMVGDELALHIENEKFVGWLEREALSKGVKIMDDTVVDVQQDDHGISGLRVQSGGNVSADLFLDCSGFYSLLLGKTLAEPYSSFKNALFCDRAVVGGWERADEPIKPYTTAEAMECGWCWQIEHEHKIIRGYVYSSPFISDEQAEREMREKNPKIGKTRIIKFATGCYRRGWVKNVVGVGNAFGFVEPLEATSLGTICNQAAMVAETLAASDCVVPQVLRDCFNARSQRVWDSIRDFLAVHYKFNRRFDNAFWRECWEKVDLGAAEEIVEYYKENGPSGLWRVPLFEGAEYRNFGMEGYLALLVGMQVPYQKSYHPDAGEQEFWKRQKMNFKAQAEQAYSITEALKLIRSPEWQWPADLYQRPQGIGLRR
jgi:tryptophan halogenase